MGYVIAGYAVTLGGLGAYAVRIVWRLRQLDGAGAGSGGDPDGSGSKGGPLAGARATPGRRWTFGRRGRS